MARILPPGLQSVYDKDYAFKYMHSVYVYAFSYAEDPWQGLTIRYADRLCQGSGLKVQGFP